MCRIIHFNVLARANNLYLAETYQPTEFKSELQGNFKKEFHLDDDNEGQADPIKRLLPKNRKAKKIFTSYNEHLTGITDAHILSLIYGSLS